MNQIYKLSPIFLQNIYISSYSILLYYQRYSGCFKRELNNLLKSQWYPKEELAILQLNNLNKIFNICSRFVPYYKNCDKYNKLKNNLKTLEHIKDLPFLEKTEIKKYPKKFIDERFNRFQLIKLHSSGTTGTPLEFYIDGQSRRKNYAFYARLFNWAGLNSFKGGAIFTGRALIPENDKNEIFWRKNFLMGNRHFSSFHISKENLQFYIQELERKIPIYIDSYPSVLNVIAEGLKNDSNIKPKAIFCSSETLQQRQRENIEDSFKCKVFDQYSCTEQALFVSQCEFGHYHIHPEYGFVEIVDNNGNEVKPGDIGEVICTSFTNKAMPLIRYRINDLVEKGDDDCPCGRKFPVINKIIGRTDDVVFTLDGRAIGRLDPVFKGIKGVLNSQIIQDKIGHLIFVLEIDSEFNEKEKLKLERQTIERLGSRIKILFDTERKIKKEKNGKFKSVINCIGK